MTRRTNRDLDQIVTRLGQVPDRVIAEECDVSVRCVGVWRQARGIPAYLPEREWTDREIALLGTMTDAEAAKKLRRTPHAVKNMRRKLRIPALRANLYERLIKVAGETVQ